LKTTESAGDTKEKKLFVLLCTLFAL